MTDPRFDDLMRLLGDRLSGSLPGAESMRPLAAAGRKIVATEDALELGANEAAALVLLYPEPATGAALVALTARAADLTHHAGQVSFPGGRIDHGEEAVEAALREANEELAVDPRLLRVLGKLSPLYIPPSGFLVQPVVGWAATRPDFRPNPGEVERLIEARVTTFCGTKHRKEAERAIRGEFRLTPFFEVGRHEVWGATAMMLAELGAVWAEILEAME